MQVYNVVTDAVQGIIHAGNIFNAIRTAYTRDREGMGKRERICEATTCFRDSTMSGVVFQKTFLLHAMVGA